MDKSNVISNLRKLEKQVKMVIPMTFVKGIEELQDVIIDKYDEELVDVVTDRNSKTNPNLYREEFAERVREFKYLEPKSDGFKVILPDMENFDFSGRLEVVRTIMEGLAGKHKEVDGDQFKAIFNKPAYNQNPVDRYVPPKQRIYIVRYTAKIRKWELDNKKKLVDYPFSNTPPIPIFDAAYRYFEDNIGKWLEEASETTAKLFTKKYAGALI
jgi:hypothetical protein